MDNDAVTLIQELTSSVGMWAVFAWLYLGEKRAHRETQARHMADLRQIAGFAKPLSIRPPYAPPDPP